MNGVRWFGTMAVCWQLGLGCAPAHQPGSPAAEGGAQEAGTQAARAGASEADSGGAGNVATAGQGAEPLAGASAGVDSCPEAIGELGVSGADRAGYPPYAASGCSLLYVASDASLRLRSLVSGAEMQIASADQRPVRPSLAGPDDDPTRVLAWESELTHSVQVRFAGNTREVRGAYARSGQPRATADAVVLTGFVTADPQSDADILLYDPSSQSLRVVGGGPGQQLFADVSATRVAYTDFAEDPDQRFDDDGHDLADVVLVERATDEHRKLELAGKQAFPLFGGDGSLVYLHWQVDHPEPKLSAYTIMAWNMAADRQRQLAIVETQPPYVRPSVYGSTVEWVERPYNADERLMRVDMQRVEPQAVFSMPGMQLFATASSARATLLATQSLDQISPRLRAIPR